MTEKIKQNLDGVPKTLLLTLYARARESQRPDPMLKDERAVEMVEQIECDFSRLRMHRHDEVAVIMRMKKIDSHVRNFLTRDPDGIVVHIGCGLDTRFERVDNGLVEWFDLDVPDVIALREKLLHSGSSRYHTLASSVLEDNWIEEVLQYKPRPFMFVAEGVLPYFEEAQVKYLFLTLLKNFPGCFLACDAHHPFVVWADNMQLALSRVEARLHWSIKTGRDPEEWGAGIRLMEEWNYYEDQDPHLKAFNWARHIPFIAKSSGIFLYQLG